MLSTDFCTLKTYNDWEKGDAMYIEIYLDSLFLVNFVMNLCLLILLDRSALRTATRMRMILGAAVGAIFSLLPFTGEGYGALKIVSGAAAGTALMLLTAFRIGSAGAFLRLFEKLLFLTFLLGGGLFFLLERFPALAGRGGIFGVMGLGVLLTLSAVRMMEGKEKRGNLCSVTLISGEGRVKTLALVDSGNALVEPISGKAVSVLDAEIFRRLWREAPILYRVIPYHSVGKKSGILKGYLVGEMQIEAEGVTKICQDVYVAVSEEPIEGVGMLVNPVLLKKNGNEGKQ